MKVQKPEVNFTGKFAPIDNPIVVVLAYEMPRNAPECQMYAGFLANAGGFDPWNGTLTPMTWHDDQLVDLYLESMTGAFERGFLSQTEWPLQLFETGKELDDFVNALCEHKERITDRQWRMLDALSAGHAEVIATANQAAEGLRDRVVELVKQKWNSSQTTAAA